MPRSKLSHDTQILTNVELIDCFNDFILNIEIFVKFFVYSA